MHFLQSLSPYNKGILYIIAGSLLLAFTFGIEQLRILVQIGAVIKILYGLYKIDAHKSLMKLINEAEKK